jgi:DNA invertase Pin-like site-specific DNA recombinase
MNTTQEVSARWVRERFSGNIEFHYLSEQASGWKRDRETIATAKALITSRTWDALVVNELRDIDRNPEFLRAFVLGCVDAGVRLIALDEHVDTGRDGWEAKVNIRMMGV